jgi:2-methylcitrate dehydratase PrpD
MDGKISVPSATEILAQFGAGIRFEELPSAVVDRLKECFLDNIGISAFAAVYAESSEPFRVATRAMSGEGGQGTVIGEPHPYPFAHAAFLNGAFAHTLDFDDTNLVGSLHPGAPVVAAALAAAEQANVNGRELIEALAAGYEVSCRVGAALGPTGYDRGFHLTAVAGVFGAVVAVAKVRKLSAQVIANALGLAGSRACGSMQYLENGAWNKRLHPGFGARDALFAVELASAGVIGASAALEGKLGLLHGYSNAPVPEWLTDGLGEKWILLETAIKPYPSCRFAHSPIDLALQLRASVPAAARAKSHLTFRLSKTAFDIVAVRQDNKLNPVNIVEAQFSMYFQVAVAWLDGEFAWKSYDRIGDADIVAFARTVDAVLDEGVAFAGATIVVETDGDVITQHVDAPLGEPQRPLSWSQLEQKFLSMAGPVFGQRSLQIASRIKTMEGERSISDLIMSFRRREDDIAN